MKTGSQPRTRRPRSQSARPKAATNGSSSSGKRIELAREVATELKSLRATLDQMMEHYRLRAGAQIGELLQAVEGETGRNLDEDGKLPPLSVTKLQLGLLRDVKLKPEKGRAKDFARLDDLLEELVSLLPPER